MTKRGVDEMITVFEDSIYNEEKQDELKNEAETILRHRDEGLVAMGKHKVEGIIKDAQANDKGEFRVLLSYKQNKRLDQQKNSSSIDSTPERTNEVSKKTVSSKSPAGGKNKVQYDDFAYELSEEELLELIAREENRIIVMKYELFRRKTAFERTALISIIEFLEEKGRQIKQRTSRTFSYSQNSDDFLSDNE